MTDSIDNKVEDASKKPRILLVDDDPNIRITVGEFLQDYGNYHVDTASDGKEALQIIRAAKKNGTPHDLYLLDVIMPNIDGPAIIEILRHTGEDGITPTIFMTGYSEMENTRIRELNPSCLLSKPFNMEILPQLVDAAIRKEPIISDHNSCIYTFGYQN
jgi:CheY-like chemotaxis protein